jgi:hypothetical protein
MTQVSCIYLIHSSDSPFSYIGSLEDNRNKNRKLSTYYYLSTYRSSPLFKFLRNHKNCKIREIATFSFISTEHTREIEDQLIRMFSNTCLNKNRSKNKNNKKLTKEELEWFRVSNKNRYDKIKNLSVLPFYNPDDDFYN